MSFYEEVDATGIVENHIKQALRLEDGEAQTILQEYQRIQGDLQGRLARSRAGSFTQQHLRGVLAQTQGAIEAITKHLAGATFQGAYRAALQGVTGLMKELSLFDEKFTGAVTPINLNAVPVAQDAANLLTTRYNTNLAAYGTDLQKQITNGLVSAVTGEASYDEVVGRIGRFFSGEEWKLHRIVRTELHHAVNLGKLKGMQELDDEDMQDLQKTLMHPMDARTGLDSQYAARLHLVREVDAPFEYVWNGKLRSFMAPPDRPNDRAILVPYRESWGAVQGPAFIPGKYPAA